MTTGRINQVCTVPLHLCERILETHLSTNTRLFELVHEGEVRAIRKHPQEQEKHGAVQRSQKVVSKYLHKTAWKETEARGT